MKKLLFLLTVLFGLTSYAQDLNPHLEFVLDLNVALDAGAINVGQVPQGGRTIIPITGGTFEGPNIRGEVVAGGADYQLHSATSQITTLDAIYSLRTDDGVNIFIENEGIICGGGNPYFFTAPKFQAPVDSKYAWLNEAIYVCRPVGFGPGIKLRVWRVCDAAGLSAIAREFPGMPESVSADPKHKGKVEQLQYEAVIDGTPITKRVQVYLPYGYDKSDKSKKYNVVYLMHGGGDNTTSFFSPDRSPVPLTQVLDHLIEDGEMDPVIVACPTFYHDDTNIGANRMDDAIALTRDFHNELRDYVIPAVEMAYNTYLTSADSIEATRDHRAFGGFSMGSLTTWYQLAHGVSEVKHYIPLSGDLWIYDNQGNKLSADVAAAWLNDQLVATPYSNDFMVYGYTGTKDIAYRPELSLFDGLRKNAPLFRINQPDANASLTVKDGGDHWYGDINQYLYEVLPLIWKN